MLKKYTLKSTMVSMFFNLLDKGDINIEPVIKDFYNNLSIGISNIIYSFNPELVIIGGGITGRGQKLLDELSPFIKSRLSDYMYENTVFKIAKYKNDAGMIGAFENFKLIKYADKNNIIVSQAHTDATHEVSNSAINNGAKGFTHAYNAMSKLHHRDIGVVGTMLLNNDAYAEVIADGVHVSPAAIKLLYKCKGRDNLILITDSMRAKYLPDGKSELGGQDVFVKNNEARLADGTLAGSILKMNDAVRNMTIFTDATLVDAVFMASTNPARNLGLKTKGLIKEGFDADLTVLDEDLNVVMTIVNGKVLYERE